MTDFTMKTVGKRKAARRPTLEEVGGFLRLGISLRKVRHLVPRGVFRFETFEDAQRWMSEETIRTLKSFSHDRPR